jgi:hypothetical protein
MWHKIFTGPFTSRVAFFPAGKFVSDCFDCPNRGRISSNSLHSAFRGGVGTVFPAIRFFGEQALVEMIFFWAARHNRSVGGLDTHAASQPDPVCMGGARLNK